MQPIPRVIANEFAKVFAGKGRNFGLSAKEITDFFGKYSNAVKPYDHYGFNPTKHDLFIESLYMLLPKEQYYSLTDLAKNPPASKSKLPSEEERNRLAIQLHSFLNTNPIGISFSKLREHVFRQDWYTAYSRLSISPSSAITAGRTLLETVLKQ